MFKLLKISLVCLIFSFQFLPSLTTNVNAKNTLGTSFITKTTNSAKKILKNITGRIVLQVEQRGEAYYHSPRTNKIYYLKDGDSAYNIMRETGLGISEADYQTLLNNDNAGNTLKLRLAGQIVLRVHKNGEAYYINPADLQVTYMENGWRAYQIMRYQSLGISDKDLSEVINLDVYNDWRNNYSPLVQDFQFKYPDNLHIEYSTAGNGALLGQFRLINSIDNSVFANFDLNTETIDQNLKLYFVAADGPGGSRDGILRSSEPITTLNGLNGYKALIDVKLTGKSAVNYPKDPIYIFDVDTKTNGEYKTLLIYPDLNTSVRVYNDEELQNYINIINSITFE